MSKSRPNGIFLALVPWLIFSVVCHFSVPAASLLALVASALVAVPGVRAGRPKLLELAAVASFAGFSIVVLAIDPGTRRHAASLRSRHRRRAARGDRLRLAAVHALHRAVRP